MYRNNYMNWMMGYHDNIDHLLRTMITEVFTKVVGRMWRILIDWAGKKKQHLAIKAKSESKNAIDPEGALKVAIQPVSNRKTKYKQLKCKGYLLSYIMRNPKGSPQLNIVRVMKDSPGFALVLSIWLSSIQPSQHHEKWGGEGGGRGDWDGEYM